MGAIKSKFMEDGYRYTPQVFSTNSITILPEIKYYQWKDKSSPDDMCWGPGNTKHLGKCEEIGGEYTTVGTLSCYNSSHHPSWERNGGSSPICGGNGKHSANKEYCCTHWNNSGDSLRTCNPNWTAKSSECANALDNQCQPWIDRKGEASAKNAIVVARNDRPIPGYPQGLRNLFKDSQCQSWCGANPLRCEQKKKEYCNTERGIEDSNCRTWCLEPENAGKCNVGAAIFCDQYDDPFCACITAKVPDNPKISGSAALQCFDAKCAKTGYKTIANPNCTFISCDQSLAIAAGGNINSKGSQFNQNCEIDASGGGNVYVDEKKNVDTSGNNDTNMDKTDNDAESKTTLYIILFIAIIFLIVIGMLTAVMVYRRKKGKYESLYG